MRPLPLLVAVLCCVAPARAAELVRVRGGGPAPTDCMLVTDVAGPASAAHGRTVHCTDGDPACDADGRADGVCTLSARICLDGGGTTQCAPEPVVHARVLAPVAGLLPLSAAVDALTMPAGEVDTCTPMVGVPVTTHQRRAGKVVLRATADMASGHSDRDRVVFVCRPGPRPVTLATLQRLIFSRSCASQSCHGAALAGGLDLTPAGAAASLVGVPASNEVARAAGVLRVVPGDPDASFLIRKLAGKLATGEGDPMPRVGSTLPPAKLDLLRRWIAGL